jgi:amino acid adenylation domain-containing protein/non-ribosomal peptide synthase protein (TIGR01720 family)
MNTIQKLIANLSPEKQEQLLQRMRAEKEPVKRASIPAQSRETNIFELSFAQQRLWFLERLEPGNTAYLVPHTQCFYDELNARALEESLNELVRRHESLRTTFAERAGQPVQIIHAATHFLLPVIDLQGLEHKRRDEEARVLVRQEIQCPCDLEQGPLFRSYLLRLESQVHWFLLTQHHIITDGWSTTILARELATVYQAFVDGQSSPLTSLPIQYADYAVWQRQWLQGEVLEAQMAYWREQLAGVEPLALPTDYPRPARWTYRGARVGHLASPEVVQALQQLCQREGVTLFMLLLAAFQALLARYTGQSDISVGTPIANRTRAEIEGVIGFFVNTLVLRSDLSGNPTFQQILAQARTICLQAYAHQDIPFEKVVEELAPERDLNRSPLFQVMFTLHEKPSELKDMAGVRIEPLLNEGSNSKFDLTFALVPTAQGLYCNVEYSTDLFEAATIQGMLAHWQILLAGITHDPQTRLWDLPLLTEAERALLLLAAKPSLKALVSEQGLHRWFEQQVQHTPDAIALVFEEHALTYDVLNRRANRLAHHLRNLGVGSEMLVALYLQRSIELVIGMLAILKAGGAYVPIDPAYPAERVAFMLSDARPAVLLTQAAFAERLSEHNIPTLCMESDARIGASETDDNLDGVVDTGQLAYVIYTSGSTGTPKGVMVTHANVSRLFAATQARFHFCAQDSWTLFHSFAFDFSVWELWGALLFGGRGVLLSYETSRNPQALSTLLQAQAITVLNQTPSAFRHLMQVEAPMGTEGSLWPSLRLIIFGGEALDLPMLAPWIECYGDQKPALVNMYGITETTVHVTSRQVSEQDVRSGLGSRIGGAIEDRELYILDEHLRPVPIGVVGQLYVGGGGLARGYLHRAELTAERFVPHPSSQQEGARLYQTGDLARWRIDGDIEYLGRIDTQVKIRGFRIELGEIEAHIARYPGVRTSVVMLREDRARERRLVAYIVPSPGEAPSRSELRRFLLERVPEYMIPAHFVLLDELPRTSNGKLDHRALPLPEQERSDPEEKLVLPGTPTEEILAGIWSSVLGIEQIGIHDNFFALGGDSIRSIQVLSQARERGIHFSLQQLFQHQTIHELVQVVGAETYRAHIAESAQAFSLITSQDRLKLPAGVEDAYPLTMLQKGMIFHSQYEPDSAVYHDIFSYQFQAALHVQHFQTAIQHLAACHPILRTAFDLNTFSEPLQLVYQTVDIPVQVEDLSRLTTTEQDEMVAKWLETEKKRPFDWAHAPLLHVHIHRRNEKIFDFTLSFHHAILDGWSVASLLTDLFEIYLSLLRGEKAVFKLPPALLYRDFVALEHKFVESEDARQFWHQKLAGSTSAVLPHWESSGQTVSPVYDLPVPISPETSAALKRLARTLAVPIKSILLAAHLRVLNFLYGQTDILTGLISNGRLEATDGERTLGLFLNTLPLRMKLSGGSWIELIQATFAAECELLPYRWYPLAEIQKQQGRHALFETAFNFIHFHVYQNLFRASTQTNEMQVLGSNAFEETNFALTANCSLDILSSQIRLSLQGNTTQFSPEQIEAIGGYYARALSSIASEPHKTYTLQSLLSARESAQLLVEWNATEHVMPDGLLLHRLFEQQVQRTPEAVALVFEEQGLTYSELDRRANQLARKLRALGIAPDERAGLCLPRSIEMMIGLMAILKAGGAYVPLDTEYPAARLQWLLSENRPRVVLTNRNLLPVLSAAHVDCHFFCLDEQETVWREEPTTPVSVQMDQDCLAYVIYTSGSTGTPKGVMCSHRAVGNHLLWLCDLMGLGEQDRVLQKAPLNFDASVSECFAPLACGGCLVLARPDGHREPAYLAEIVECESISVIQFVPTLLQIWVEEAGIERCRGLRHIISAGEALSTELQARCLERCPDGVQLYNLYGPTEAATDTSYWKCRPEWGQGDSSKIPSRLPIGRPIANMRIYVLDHYLQPVPIGVTGDVYLAGIGLARGYFQRPDLTAERFIPHPYGEPSGERLYRTGDLGRLRPDGAIEYVGRADEQVKLHGVRIELGEIEAVLGEHPQVREHVVVIREGRAGEQQLVAYVVTTQQEHLSIQEVRRYMQERVPAYMVPAQVVLLDALPLTPNGKVDRKALPEPGQVGSQEGNVFVAPRNAVEKELAAIWANVLRLERVGIRDNFFELGGDSIISIQIIARARQRGLQLTLKQLFQYPTIEELSSMVDTETLVQAEQGLVVGSLPLTPIQRWFFDLQLPMQQHWNQAVFFEVAERLHASFLEQVVRALSRHHDALRLRFIQQDGIWQQYISEHEEAQSFLQVDLSSVSEYAQRDVATQLAAETQASLDLAEGPLMRMLLFDMGRDKAQCLLIIVHHLAIDGVSWRILLEDLQMAYQQLKLRRAIELPAKTSSFKIWAESLEAYAQSKAIQQGQAYWLSRNIVQGQPLPLDFPRHDQVNTVASARTISVSLSDGETKALLEEIPAIYRSHINDILLTALAYTLTEWTGSSSHLIDLEGHGRESLFANIDVSRTVGWFTSIFPVYLDLTGIDLAGTSSLEEAIERVKEQLRAIPDHGIGYGILRYLSPDSVAVRKLRAQPPAEVAFNYLGQFNQAESALAVNSALRLSSGPARNTQGKRTHLLEINCRVSNNCFQAAWSYSEHFHRHATIEKLGTAFTQTLRAIIRHGQSSGMSAYAPASFPNVELSQEQLEKIALEMDLG